MMCVGGVKLSCIHLWKTKFRAFGSKERAASRPPFGSSDKHQQSRTENREKRPDFLLVVAAGSPFGSTLTRLEFRYTSESKIP